MMAPMRPPLAAVTACRYVLGHERAVHGERWLQGPRHPPLPCRSTVPEVRLFAERRLCELPEAAARSLVAWAEGLRPAELYFRPLAAGEVLALAARGRRCVSLLDHPEGLGFAIHDLCHLEKFADPMHHAGQVGFFALLEQALGHAGWAELESGLDAAWKDERDHVLADMNGSSLFLYCGLRSRLAKATARVGVPLTERLELLVTLLGLEGTPREAALATASRWTPAAVSEPLEVYLAGVGAAILAAPGR